MPTGCRKEPTSFRVRSSLGIPGFPSRLEAMIFFFSRGVSWLSTASDKHLCWYKAGDSEGGWKKEGCPFCQCVLLCESVIKYQLQLSFLKAGRYEKHSVRYSSDCTWKKKAVWFSQVLPQWEVDVLPTSESASVTRLSEGKGESEQWRLTGCIFFSTCH